MVLLSGSYDEKQTRKGGFSSNRDAIEKMSEKMSLCLDFFSFLLRATVGQLYWQDMSCNYCLSPDERVQLPPGRTQCEDRTAAGGAEGPRSHSQPPCGPSIWEGKEGSRIFSEYRIHFNKVCEVQANTQLLISLLQSKNKNGP